MVFIVALLVFGPKRLPELGKTLGKFVLEVRKGISDVRYQMESELSEIEKEQQAVGKKETPAQESAEQQGEFKEKEGRV